MCSEEARRIRLILIQVEKLVSLCHHKSLSQESGDDKLQWLIALENVKLFHLNLWKDLKAVGSSVPSSANGAETPDPYIQSVKDVEREYKKLTMEYYHKPEVWSTNFIGLSQTYQRPTGLKMNLLFWLILPSPS